MRKMAVYAGALLTAGLSSACCWIPLLLGGAGAGALGLGTTLEPFRPYLTGLTFAFLAIAFYLTYRPERTPADCCAVSPSPTKRLQKAVLWLVTLFALFTLLVPHLLARRAEHVSALTPIAASLQTALFRVDRISCQSCAVLINKRLDETPGVHRVEVDFSKHQVLVYYNPNRVQPSQLQTILEQAGFPAALVETSQQDSCCSTQ